MTQPYSDDERLKALRRLVSNDDNVSQTVRELREEGMPLTRETLMKWRDTTLRAAESAPVGIVADTLGVTAESLPGLLVREVTHVALGHLRDIATWDEEGRLKFIPSADLDYAASASIQSIEYEARHDLAGSEGDETAWETVKVKVKRESKLGAMTLLAKILGMVQTGTTTNVNVDARRLDVTGVTLADIDARIAALRSG